MGGKLAFCEALNELSAKSQLLLRLTVDCPGCDLREAQLKRRDLTGANLAGANLTFATLHGSNLRDANLAGAVLVDANRTPPTFAAPILPAPT